MKIEELESFLKKEDGFDVFVIGKSVLGKNIYSVNKEFDKNFRWVIITGGMHAREHLSTDLICRFISLARDKKFNFNISFVPLVNPDGVTLCCDGCCGMSEEQIKQLHKINGGDDFSLFKANINGVDLNNNWSARWHKKFSTATKPASQGFYGDMAMSEPEVQALAKWTEKLRPFLTINYHLKGEEIYYDFFQDEERMKRDLLIASVFAKSSGYKIKSTQFSSSGGYKDWCVEKFMIPSLTIELGDDKFSHPYPKSEIENIFEKNKHIYEDIEEALKIFNSFEKL